MKLDHGGYGRQDAMLDKKLGFKRKPDPLNDDSLPRAKVEEWRQEYQEVFQEEIEKQYPRHPYKIRMEIVKKNDLDAGGDRHASEDELCLLKALEELKEEYKEKWKSLK